MDDILVKLQQEGLIDEQACRDVQQLHAAGKPLDSALMEAGGMAPERLLPLLADEFGVPYTNLEQWQPAEGFLSQFPAGVLLKYHLLPLEERDGVVTVAASSLSDNTGLDELRLLCGKVLRLTLAPAPEIERCHRRFLGVGAETVQSLVSDSEETDIQVIAEEAEGTVDLMDAAEDASIVRFVNQVLTEAIRLRATDVHFEPFEARLRVRYRVDGVLQEATIPAEAARFQPAIVSRAKILSRLDIAEKRLPQDGRIRLKVGGRDIDVRVSVIPMLHGEAIVLRLLDRSAVLLGLESLGMGAEDRQVFQRILEVPHGIVLVTGPTGSGKTTTLYAGLSHINDIARKIITIEDPIEYHLEGINQIQVSTKAGLTFALGLRSILRHDPDVILVGEIRDYETAEIAVQASLTGHLVFSTLHTNDAPGALTRLVDMGVEPYLVASSLEAVLAQRLVRLICPHCHEELSRPDGHALCAELGVELPGTVHRGAGCRECLGTGYLGRTGIFELMAVTEEIRTLILERASAGEVRKCALQSGMRSLRDDGWRHVLDGRTTIEEVLRVTKDEVRNDDKPPAGVVGAEGTDG